MKTLQNHASPFILSVLLLVLTACISLNGEIPITGDEQTPDANLPLTHTGWRLKTYGVPNSQSEVLEGSPVTILFQEADLVAGSSGCNTFGAEYHVLDDNGLSITNILATQMACTAEGVMEQERQYLGALGSASRFQIAGDKLTIWYANGERTLEFSKITVGDPRHTPTPTFVEQPQRIEFAVGFTSTTLTGQLDPAGSEHYVLRAVKGQTMSVDLNFTAGAASLAVWGEDGTFLLSDHAEAASFRRELPSSQDYYILVKGRPDGSTFYTMTVTISALIPGPERIVFRPGNPFARISDQFRPSGSDQYIVRGFAGQTLSVELRFIEGWAILAVWGANGNVLLSEDAEATKYQGVLPATQDYYILLKGRSDRSITYTMTVRLPPLP